ncbi:MAG: DUF3303 family protein [Candidatus Bathyarchaeia archaeon]
MTKYYVKWTVNPLEIPKNPEERMKLWQSALEMVKADMKAGIVKEWGFAADSSEGFGITEFANETDHAAYALKWIPVLNSVDKPVLSVDECLEVFQKLTTSMKK